MPSTKYEKIVLFSNTCGGQNQNQNFSTMCLHTVTNTSNSIDCIEHLYFESGHSQMECDSVHSAVENACRHQNIYAPTDYYSIVKSARRNNPYNVTVMDTEMFHDYKFLSQSMLKNRTKGTDSTVVNWLKVKWFKYERQNPAKNFFKYDYVDDFRVIDVVCQSQGRKMVRRPELKKLYALPPKI